MNKLFTTSTSKPSDKRNKSTLNGLNIKSTASNLGFHSEIGQNRQIPRLSNTNNAGLNNGQPQADYYPGRDRNKTITENSFKNNPTITVRTDTIRSNTSTASDLSSVSLSSSVYSTTPISMHSSIKQSELQSTPSLSKDRLHPMSTIPKRKPPPRRKPPPSDYNNRVQDVPKIEPENSTRNQIKSESRSPESMISSTSSRDKGRQSSISPSVIQNVSPDSSYKPSHIQDHNYTLDSDNVDIDSINIQIDNLLERPFSHSSSYSNQFHENGHDHLKVSPSILHHRVLTSDSAIMYSSNPSVSDIPDNTLGVHSFNDENEHNHSNSVVSYESGDSYGFTKPTHYENQWEPLKVSNDINKFDQGYNSNDNANIDVNGTNSSSLLPSHFNDDTPSHNQTNNHPTDSFSFPIYNKDNINSSSITNISSRQSSESITPYEPTELDNSTSFHRISSIKRERSPLSTRRKPPPNDNISIDRSSLYSKQSRSRPQSNTKSEKPSTPKILGKGQPSTYIQLIRKKAGTSYSEIQPPNWPLPISLTKVKGGRRVHTHAHTSSMASRKNRLFHQSFSGNLTKMDTRHAKLQPRLLASEVDDDESEFVSLYRQQTKPEADDSITNNISASGTSINVSGEVDDLNNQDLESISSTDNREIARDRSNSNNSSLENEGGGLRLFVANPDLSD